MTGDNRFKPIAVDMGGSLTSTPGGSAPGAVSGNTMLRYGSSGNDVRNLQTTLSGLGYDVGTVDGIFGNQTKSAVMQYQKDMGLSADGIVGDQTWGALSGSNKPNIPNYNDVLNGMAAQNPQVSQNTVSQMTVPEVTPTTPAPKTQSGIPNYNDVLNDLAAKNPQVSPNVVDMLRVPDMNPTGNGGTPVTGAAPTGGGNNPGGNVSTGGNTTATTVQTPTSQDILSMYEQSSTTETPVQNTPEPAEPAPAPSAYTPPARNPYYEPNYRRLLNEMEAYPDFRFDQNSDPLWASLAKQYRREGQRATADALGQAAGLTGGIASTAAVTAASQAGDYYGAQLSDRLQDVYNNAYQQYLDRYSRLLGLTQEYRWGTDFEEGQFTGDRSFDRGVYTDDRNFDYDQYLSDRDFKYKQETDAYNRQQTAMQDAQSRVEYFISSMGGDPSQLDPELLRQSGLSPAEINQMRQSYLQREAAAAVVKASGGGSSSGGGSRGGGTGSGGETGGVSDASDAESGGYQNTYDKMFNAGIRDAGQARDWLKQNGFTPTEQKSMAEYFESVYMPGKNGDNAGIDTAPSDSDTPAANVGNSVAGKRVRTVGDDQISFSYDQGEGTYRFGGNTYMTLDDVIDAINRTNMTDNQLNAVIKSMRAYLGDKIVDRLLSD